MQTEESQLLRQQEILTALGYYHSKCDGIWGPKSIEAMMKFESSKNFVPGRPNNGMPLSSNPPYPDGFIMDENNLFHHLILDSLVQKKSTKTTEGEQPKPVETKVETKQDVS